MVVAQTKIKETGVPWIGKIPEDWKLTRIKNEFKVSKNVVGEDSDKYQLLSLTLNGIIYRDVESGKGKFPAEFNTYQPVEPNDLVFCLFDIEETPRTIGLSDKNGMITGAYTILKNKNDNIFNKYYYYLFLMVDKDKKFKIYYSGLRNTIKDGTFQSIPLPLPKFETQVSISNFLDDKIDKIAIFIKNKKRLIELLEEQKISIINKAVTKGIDENVKMKDSGIPWIGEIPENWEVRRLKFCIKGKLEYGANESAESNNPSNPRYIRITDFGNNGLLKDDTFCSLEYDIAKNYLLKEGDILFARSGGTVGKTFIFSNYNGLACFAGYLIRARVDKKILNEQFLYLFTKSNSYDNWKNSIFSESTIQNIGADKYNLLIIPLPSIDIQNDIVKYIDKETEQINKAILKVEKEISLIEEYRDSLIYHAVTGKLNIG